MYRQAGYDLRKAETGIVFLDFLDSPGSRAMNYGEDADAVGEEILKGLMGKGGARAHNGAMTTTDWPHVAEIIEGKLVEVTRPRALPGTDDSGEAGETKEMLSTKHIFFICFGVKGSLGDKAEAKDKVKGRGM